jgi:hypothetical protein
VDVELHAVFRYQAKVGEFACAIMFREDTGGTRVVRHGSRVAGADISWSAMLVDWARKILWKVNKEGAIGVDLLALSDFSCLCQSLFLRVNLSTPQFHLPDMISIV